MGIPAPFISNGGAVKILAKRPNDPASQLRAAVQSSMNSAIGRCVANRSGSGKALSL